jgi:predicted ATPase
VGGLDDRRPVRRVQPVPGAVYDPGTWPYTLAPVAQLLDTGLDLPAGVPFLVGENGSGKFTLVEAIAAAAGLNPQGGSRSARHATRPTESPLHELLQLVRSPAARGWSYFLRAETMHGLYTYLEELPAGGSRPTPRLHQLSHGESFLEVLAQHFHAPGFYLLDEPDSALSFSSCLALLGVLDQLVRDGGQAICAIHSPLLTALPGANILQLDDSGYTPVHWRDLTIVDHWRRYLTDPHSYLRHILG